MSGDAEGKLLKLRIPTQWNSVLVNESKECILYQDIMFGIGNISSLNVCLSQFIVIVDL